MEVLIEAVEEHNCLYAISSKDFKDGTKQAHARGLLAKFFTDCSKYLHYNSISNKVFNILFLSTRRYCYQMDNLKQRFTKERKLQNEKPPSDSGAGFPRTQWVHCNRMRFLDIHIKQRS